MSDIIRGDDYKRMLAALTAIADDSDGKDSLGDWAYTFVRDINRKVSTYCQGSILNLSQKQLDKIQELYDQHC